MPFYQLFWREASPTKIDYRTKVGTLILTSLLEDTVCFVFFRGLGLCLQGFGRSGAVFGVEQVDPQNGLEPPKWAGVLDLSGDLILWGPENSSEDEFSCQWQSFLGVR